MGMEDEKKIEGREEPTCEPTELTEGVTPTPAAPAETADGETVTPAAPAETTDGETVTPVAPAEAPAPATPAPQPIPAPDWRFGEPSAAPAEGEKRKRSGQFGFFAIFGTVFGVCVLLLVLVLCIGDGGFRIVRELQTERVVYVREDDGTSGLLTPSEAAHKVNASTVTVSVTTESGTGIGSGFVYTADGYILTNHHVIASALTIQVVLSDGTAYDATPVGSDEAGDVAVLKIEAEGLTSAELGSSAELLTGEEVVAIGTPASLNYAGTATFGTVSNPKRLLPITDSTTGSVTKKMTLIQTDTSVNPGNSGGPLADMYGRVVGMVVMKITSYGGTSFEGIGFALPIDGVRTIADEIIKNGSFTGVNPITEGRSLLGVTGHGGQKGVWYSDTPDASGSMASSETEKEGYHLMRESGVYVMGISGTNATGRVQVGDIIMKVNGLSVISTTDLIEIVNRYYAGQTVTLTVLRGDTQIQVEIELYEESAS